MAAFDKTLTIINNGENLPVGNVQQVQLYSDGSSWGVFNGEIPMVPAFHIDGQVAYPVVIEQGSSPVYKSYTTMTDLRVRYNNKDYWICTGYNYTPPSYAGYITIPQQIIYNNDTSADYEPPTGSTTIWTSDAFTVDSGTKIEIVATNNAFSLQEGFRTGTSGALEYSHLEVYIIVGGTTRFSGVLEGGGAGHESQMYYLSVPSTSFTVSSGGTMTAAVAINYVHLLPQTRVFVNYDIDIKVGLS